MRCAPCSAIKKARRFDRRLTRIALQLHRSAGHANHGTNFDLSEILRRVDPAHIMLGTAPDEVMQQSEFYCGNVGDLARGTDFFDFYLSRRRRWAVELVLRSEQLDDRVERFALDGIYAPILCNVEYDPGSADRLVGFHGGNQLL